MRHFRVIFTCWLFALITSQVKAQSGPTKSDYQRAVSFLWQKIDGKKAFNLNVEPHWFADSTGLWYVYQARTGKAYMKITFPKLDKDVLFDHQRLAGILKDSLKEDIHANDLPLTALTCKDKTHLRFNVKRRAYVLDLNSYKLTREKERKESDDYESKSPDGKWIAYAKDYNLYVKSAASGAVRQLSTKGKKNLEYATYYGWGDIMEGEGGERPRRFDVRWSPDSKWIQTFICDLNGARKMYLLDWSVDTLYRARLLSYYRASPGDTTLVHMTPVFFEVASGREIHPDLPRNTHTNPVSFEWSKKEGQVYANYNDRGYQRDHIVKLDLMQGKVQPLILETSKTNIDNFNYWLLEKRDKIIFASERSGWRQLYSLDLKNLEVKHLAAGDYYVNDIRRLDEKNGMIYFSASGREPGRNPYHQYLYSLSLDKNEVKSLTPENANHDVAFSPDGRYFFDNYSTAELPTTSVLRESKAGKIVLEISHADVQDLTALNWHAPEVFTARGRDGKTDIYGAIWKPTNFDPNRKYPVIDQSYTGPHTQMFPRNFIRVLANNNQALAELGFIVITVDGLGSSGRSKAFHDFSYAKLGMNLTDHVLAMKQLATRYPWMDIGRVGIFGHSAGGYDAAHGLLQFPDFYKVGVASSGDHDHRMEKDWWPEMYMGWPVDTAYQLQSNITMASKLKGKLLLVHGGIDENVNPSATFKLAEALVKADKEFDLLILPSQHHGYTGKYSEYFTKKRWNYFVEHLQGAKPIWDFDF